MNLWKTKHIQASPGAVLANTNAKNEMLKRVQHDKKRYVIPNLFRNLEFINDNELIAFVLVEEWGVVHEKEIDTFL